MAQACDPLIIDDTIFDFEVVTVEDYTNKIKEYFETYPPDKFGTKLESSRDFPGDRVLLIFQRYQK